MKERQIFIIEGDAKTAAYIRQELATEHYDCTTDTLGLSALNKLAGNQFDLIVLDIRLLDISGLLLCKEIRKISAVPVLIISDCDDITTKVKAFEYGANDYLTKPFNCRELSARIHALLHSGKAVCNNFRRTLTLKDLLVDLDAHEVYIKERRISLTKKEFSLLTFLIHNKNIVLSRHSILEHVWGYDFFGTTNVVDVYIRYLRSKLCTDRHESYITTVRGVGYIVRE